MQAFMMIDTLVQNIVDEVKNVSGVKAIVLGGSRARGTHTPSSDIDLGIYYDSRHSLDLSTLGKVATELDDRHRTDVITPLGGWGPWINGGGWLQIQSIPVDFLFVLENFITFKGNITHGLEHYFEVELDREDVKSDTDGIEFLWFSSKELANVDLRPHIVRDHIVKGTYRSVRHLISKDNVY